MNIALVHELLTMRGGAERTLRVLAAMFPEAPIFTLLYDEQKLSDWFPKERVRTSSIQCGIERLPFIAHSSHLRQGYGGQAKLKALLYNHHLYLKKFPAAVEAWGFSGFDLVISSSSAFAHGIITNGQPKHLCYAHSPARYLWDRTHDVLERAGRGLLGPLKRWYLERVFHRLRIWDAEVADRPDQLLAASKEVQRRIELYWRRKSEVIYPPIDDFWFQNPPTPYALRPTPFFLVVSTLVPYKRIDIAIEACNQLKLPLKIVGEGPDRKRLERLAGPTVEFLGYIPEAQVKELYSTATALLFPGEEDFGLVPLEAMACGSPVIALRKGGALETVIEGEIGTFFDESSAESLAQVLRTFKRSDFDPAACRAQAEKFSRKRFEAQIRSAIEHTTANR